MGQWLHEGSGLVVSELLLGRDAEVLVLCVLGSPALPVWELLTKGTDIRTESGQKRSGVTQDTAICCASTTALVSAKYKRLLNGPRWTPAAGHCCAAGVGRLTVHLQCCMQTFLLLLKAWNALQGATSISSADYYDRDESGPSSSRPGDLDASDLVNKLSLQVRQCREAGAGSLALM